MRLIRASNSHEQYPDPSQGLQLLKDEIATNGFDPEEYLRALLSVVSQLPVFNRNHIKALLHNVAEGDTLTPFMRKYAYLVMLDIVMYHPLVSQRLDLYRICDVPVAPASDQNQALLGVLPHCQIVEGCGSPMDMPVRQLMAIGIISEDIQEQMISDGIKDADPLSKILDVYTSQYDAYLAQEVQRRGLVVRAR